MTAVVRDARLQHPMRRLNATRLHLQLQHFQASSRQFKGVLPVCYTALRSHQLQHALLVSCQHQQTVPM
jgi:hypothetical protein